MSLMKNDKTGILYLVGTPIGNLEDISKRALKTLESVQIVACEDTRRTGLLLSKYNIKARLVSYHEHNKSSKGDYLISLLMDGNEIALVSDAGMPSISDPGNDIVKICSEKDIKIVVVPGPCAAITALSGSQLNTSKFVFEGFIPSSGKARKDALRKIENEERTLVFYEAPHRLIKTLTDFTEYNMGERRLTIARELTKLYEEFIRLSVNEALSYYNELSPKGEYVLVLEGLLEYNSRIGKNETKSDGEILDLIKEDVIKQLNNGKSVKEISINFSKKHNIKKNKMYAIIQQIKTEIK